MNFKRPFAFAFTIAFARGARSALAAVAAWLCAGTSLSAEAPAVIRYPSKEQPVTLIATEDGDLVIAAGGGNGRDNGRGRAFLPIADLRRQQVVINAVTPDGFAEAVNALERGQPLAALPVLEATVEPLVPFLGLGEISGNMTTIAALYLDALVGAEAWDRALGLVRRVPIAKVAPTFLDSVSNAVLAMREAGAPQGDDLISAILQTADWDRPQLERVMALAGARRNSGGFDDAFQLYRMAQAYDSDLQIEARLWAAYAGLHSGREQAAEVLLREVPPVEPGEAVFALRKLIEAQMAERGGNLNEAMAAAAQGRVYANTSQPWYPELLHTVASLYQRLGETGAARLAHEQVVVLFPQTPWAEAGRLALDAGDKPDSQESSE